MSDPDIEFLNNADLVDNDLKLAFMQKGITSAPDIAVPVYQFQMMNVLSSDEMGGINLRAGYTENIEQYRGNIGFTVFEEFRGQHYSARSCILLKPFMKSLGLKTIWLTCNSDNLASKKNLEYIGATNVETTRIADDSPYVEFYPPHARVKLRYKWEIQ
jgi:tagatose 1,6-diphosphate aldolase